MALSAAFMSGTKLTLPGELLTGEHMGTEELVARLYQRKFFSPLPLCAKAYADAARAEVISPQLMAAKYM
jgi:hypothetical protein